MLTVEIKINGEDLYRVEAYLQPGGDRGGICLYKIVTNDVDAGAVRHDRTDGAWALAQRILDAFSAPEKTLQELGGAHTAMDLDETVRAALFEPGTMREGLREWAMTREAVASGKLALAEGQ